MPAKSHLKIPNQSSQESSPGTPTLNFTPATRKKSAELFSGSPLSTPLLHNLVNDDRSEKKQRLQARLSTAAQQHLGSPAVESSNKTPGSASTLSGWNATQVTEHLHNCIQLSRDNKINVRNAFSLHLIDTMKDLVKKEKETNFQMAGSSIEAGAKIYASRVDAIHIQALQVLDQVSQLDKDGGKATEHVQGDDGPEAKRKTIKKKKKVIETDLRKINVSEVEQSHMIDPLLQKLSKEGDSNFGGLLLSALSCAYDNGGLMLDGLSSTTAPSDYKLCDRPFPKCELLKMDLIEREICPTFSNYEFNSKEKHPIFAALDSRDDDLRFDPNRNMATQNEDIVEGFHDGSFGADDEGAAAMDVDDRSNGFVDYISKSTGLHSTGSALTDNIYNSMLPMLSKAGGDYSFFGGMKNMWAGPAYWKAPRLAIGNKRAGSALGASVKSKKTTAEKFVIDFEADIDFKKQFRKTRAATCIAKRTLEKYKTLQSKLVLPEASHYKSKELLCLFVRPNVYVCVKNNADSTAVDDSMSQSQPYDYLNKTDVDNFCPNISGAEDSNDLQMSLFSQPTALNMDESLVGQPALTERINIQYASRPKRIDFKRLQRNMWGIFSERPNDKENEENSTDVPDKSAKTSSMLFSDLYTKTGSMCPTHEARDLSQQIAFVALLHVCNEKNLLLKSTESYSDLEIRQAGSEIPA